jgi:hypothetical protein
MARSFTRASIIGSRNTRYSNTTGDLDLQVELLDSSGNGNLVEAVAFSEDASGSLNSASADAATEANVGILFSSPGETATSPVIRSSRGGRVGVFGRTDVFALAAGSETELATEFADASANFNGPTGGIINDTGGTNFINNDGANGTPNPDIKIAGAGQIGVEMINVADATAAGEEGATAQADMGDGFFGIKDTGIQINGGAANTTPGDLPESQVVSEIGAGIFSAAYSTTGDASANSGSLADTTEVVGIYNGLVSGGSNNPQATSIDFASSGLVSSEAALEIGSTAETTSGDASANTLVSLAAGIYNADNGVVDTCGNSTTTTDLLIQIDGPLSIVEGDAVVLADATAVSDTGAGLAGIQADLIGGIVDQRTLNDRQANNSLISFGDSGTVRANAFADNVAYAESSGVGGDASFAAAIIDNDEVVGLAMDVVADGSLSIEASATSIQNATASGDNFDGGSDPFAWVAGEDAVLGVVNSEITTFDNLQGISIGADLVGNATAVSDQGSGGTSAFAGEDSLVSGIIDSDLFVAGGLQSDGGSAMDLDISASSALSATATSNADDVVALAGGGFLAPPAEVTGVRGTDIGVFGGGNDQGSLNVNVNGSADAVADTDGSGTALAFSGMEATGVRDSNIYLRGDTGAASDGLNVTVGLTGSAEATGADASGGLFLLGVGIDISGSAIEIGRNGSVRADTTIANPTVSLTSTDGNDVDASGFIGGAGIYGNGSITLGDNGSIIGSSTISGVDISAATDGAGDASGGLSLQSVGLADEVGGSTFAAGLNSGDIDGQSYASGSVSADSANGDASGTTFAQLGGIAGLNLEAGQLTSGNLVQGISDGSFLTTATTSGQGDASAYSQIGAVGISADPFGTTNTRRSLRVNGNVNAQATLSNIVVADSALGSAEALAQGSVIGIENMDVATTGPSTINVRAGGTFSATSYGGGSGPL